MSLFLVFSNIHLAIELFSAIVFFVIAWLFFEGYLIKHDFFSVLRSVGFLMLSVWFVTHALYGLGEPTPSWAIVCYLVSLTLIFLSLTLETLPPKPTSLGAMLSLPFGEVILKNYAAIATVLLLLITAALLKRYAKDIERLWRWLIIGFGILTAASAASLFAGSTIDAFMLGEHMLKIAAVGAILFWIGQWISLRIREETLLVFIAVSLFGVVLLTTTFSVFLLQRVESDARTSLALSAQVFNFYLDSLKGKALASAQVLAEDEALSAALRFKETAGLADIASEFIKTSGMTFVTFSLPNGAILYKFNFPIKSDENMLTEAIGGEAVRGRPAVTIDTAEVEGFSIRAATPVLYSGKIVGVVTTGYLIDSEFAKQFKKISSAETTVFADHKVVASSVWSVGEPFDDTLIEQAVGQGGPSVQTVKIVGEEVISAFQPVANFEGRTVALFSIATTPGELFRSTQATNQFTMLIVLVIVLILALPLYKFTGFLLRS